MKYVNISVRQRLFLKDFASSINRMKGLAEGHGNIPVLQLGKWGSGRLSDSIKVTYEVCNRDRNCIQSWKAVHLLWRMQPASLDQRLAWSQERVAQFYQGGEKNFMRILSGKLLRDQKTPFTQSILDQLQRLCILKLQTLWINQNRSQLL